jgi:hypothetical protein
MPYFCGSNQRFTNLVTSDAWKSEVHPEDRGIRLQGRFSTSSSTRASLQSARAATRHHPGRSGWREVPRAGLEDAAAILPHGWRQPDAGGLGRDAIGDQAGRGRCARSVRRCALCLRLQGHPEPRDLHPGRAGQSGLLDEPRVVQQPAVPTCRKASSSPARSPRSRTLRRCQPHAPTRCPSWPNPAWNSTRSPTTSWPNGRRPAATSAGMGPVQGRAGRVHGYLRRLEEAANTWAATTSTTPDKKAGPAPPSAGGPPVPFQLPVHATTGIRHAASDGNGRSAMSGMSSSCRQERRTLAASGVLRDAGADHVHRGGPARSLFAYSSIWGEEIVAIPSSTSPGSVRRRRSRNAGTSGSTC